MTSARKRKGQQDFRENRDAGLPIWGSDACRQDRCGVWVAVTCAAVAIGGSYLLGGCESVDSGLDSPEGTPARVVIEGHILTASESPISGVVVAGDGDVQGETDAQGLYSVSVPADWSGTLTPTHAGYDFEPASRSYSNVTDNVENEDYTGTLRMVTISGRVVMLTPPPPPPLPENELLAASGGSTAGAQSATTAPAPGELSSPSPTPGAGPGQAPPETQPVVGVGT